MLNTEPYSNDIVTRLEKLRKGVGTDNKNIMELELMKKSDKSPTEIREVYQK